MRQSSSTGRWRQPRESLVPLTLSWWESCLQRCARWDAAIWDPRLSFSPPVFPCILFPHMTFCTFGFIVVINLCFSVSAGILWMVLWCVLSPRFCLLKPQLFEADGHPSWVWFCQRFLPVKRESFLSTVASGMLRMGNWTEEKFQLQSVSFLC